MAQRLVRHHWPGTPLVSKITPRWRGWFRSVPELQSVHALLDAWRGPVTVIMPYSGDEHDSISVPPADAEKLYRAGMALIFPGAQALRPELERQLLGIVQDLGLPSYVDARCIIYAAPAGRGAEPHFDANANFAIQLSGRKRWGLAENRHVASPTDRYTVGMPGVPSRLAPYTAKLPKTMPKHVRYVEVRPWDQVFVPRGAWHETYAITETLSLNFTLSQPTWAMFMLRTLLPILTRDKEWRELADGVASANVGRTAIARQRAAELAQQLAGALGRFDTMRAVGPQWQVVPRDETQFRRNVLARLRVNSGSASVFLDGTKTVEFDTDADVAHVLTWISKRKMPFQGGALAKLAPDLSTMAQRRLLALLVDAGVIERVGPQSSDAVNSSGT